MCIIIRGGPQVIISVLVAEEESMEHVVPKTQSVAFSFTMPCWKCGCYISLLTFHGYLEFNSSTAYIYLVPGGRK